MTQTYATQGGVVHPGAWWLWALGLVAVSASTTNPLLLGLVIAVAATTVAGRRSAAPWAVGFRWYLAVAGIVLVTRVLFRMLTAGAGPTVLFTLPEIDLPAAAAGISLLGPVSAEALLAGGYDGLRLATMIICVGAANSLANPKRLLAAMPAALYEAGTVLVVTVSVFPQLAESVGRVRRARRLRAGPSGRRHLWRSVVIPVLTDALDRSLLLAASMDSRGYGRHGAADPRARRITSLLLLIALTGIAVGCYAVLDATASRFFGGAMVLVGGLLAAVGFRLAGRGVRRSRYRPERWGGVEWSITAGGVVAAAAVLAAPTAALYPSSMPLQWPQLPGVAVAGVVIAALSAGVRSVREPRARR